MPEWWDDLFGSTEWQAVQRGWSDVEDTPDQAERVSSAIGLGPGAKVLDAPAGDGRIALELAGRGYDVVGVDLVEAFVDAARSEADRRGIVNASFRVGDVRVLDGLGRFDAAICVWGSFGYFDDAGNLAQASAAARALVPGGRYLIDTPTLETVVPRFRERHWFRVRDTVVLEERRLALGTSRVETEWTFLRPDAPSASHRSSVRLYSVHELTELLGQAGFGSFELFDDELASFAPGSERLWIVATTEGAG